MGLNISKGNMYEDITHTYNIIKGECHHKCSYCYMNHYGKQNKIRFDRKELKTDLEKNNFIFVGSSCDMFSEYIPDNWIKEILLYCSNYYNKYLFQSKNPKRMLAFKEYFPLNTVLCTTIETNRIYKKIMGNTPSPFERAKALQESEMTNYLTIEPIMDFDYEELLVLVNMINPKQINIGADSEGYKLPEPSKMKLEQLIFKLRESYKVILKANLKRLLLSSE